MPIHDFAGTGLTRQELLSRLDQMMNNPTKKCQLSGAVLCDVTKGAAWTDRPVPHFHSRSDHSHREHQEVNDYDQTHRASGGKCHGAFMIFRGDADPFNNGRS